ncbi:MAG: HEAT repeat domain-containing protein [Deltaproteobacteria bacterium]|nr:HEAT repeat domain-containing protein [Deltaproteobacteria bacterium]
MKAFDNISNNISEYEKINVRSAEKFHSFSQVSSASEVNVAPDEVPDVKLLLAPGPSDRGFAIGLYQEHLEEIGFLFSQCKALFSDPEINWPEVAEFEERLAAHVDAIELGEDLALRCARQLLKSDDEEEMRAAAYTLTTVNGDQTMDDVLKTMVNADDELISYFVDALKHTSYKQTSDQLLQFLSHERPEISLAAIEILDYRREGEERQLVPLLQDVNSKVISVAVQALGRLRHKDTIPYLERSLNYEDPTVQQNASLALLRIGHYPAVKHLSTLCQGDPSAKWAAGYLALSGRADDLHPLISAYNNLGMTSDVLKAIGVLGNVDAVEMLISELNSKDEALRVAAGEALELLTGAGLKETITVVEKIDKDELFEGEEPPEPGSEEVEHVCTSYDEWANWWNQNRSRFQSTIRWRYGKPFDFGLCIDEIGGENARFGDRQRAYLELVIRSGHDIPFEPDWFVAKQRESLHQWQIWWQENRSIFAPGKWYFHGKET